MTDGRVAECRDQASGCAHRQAKICAPGAAICRRIAEFEGDVFKVMAVSDHADTKEAQKHCDRFNRMGKTDSAIAGLPGGAENEQDLTNLPGRFIKK